MLKFLFTLIILAGLAFGGVYFFLRDSALFTYWFPQHALVQGAEAPEHIAVRTLVGMRKRGELIKLDAAGLTKIYENAVERKFQSAANFVNGKLVLPWKTYIDMERDYVIRGVITEQDKNRDGEIERDEWKGSRTAFGRLDSNDDEIVTQQEIWDVDKYDKARWFKRADRNKDDNVSREEFIASFAGKGKTFVKKLDSNNSGFLDELELDHAETFIR